MIVHRAMINATADLVAYFSCTSGFTQSDEITLLFPAPVTPEDLELEEKNPNQLKKSAPFNGRVQKITSLAAGYCSVRFNYHLQNQPILESDPPIVNFTLFPLLNFSLIQI